MAKHSQNLSFPSVVVAEDQLISFEDSSVDRFILLNCESKYIRKQRMIRNTSTGNNINNCGETNGADIQTESNCEENGSTMIATRPSSPKTSTDRPSPWAIITLGLLGLYSFAVNRYLFIQHEESILIYGERGATLRRCIDSADGLWTPQDNLKRPSIIAKKKPNFRLLCTSNDRRISWGSYKLRCNDLKRWADVCVPNIDITVGVSIEQLHELWSNGSLKRATNASDFRPIPPGKNMTFDSTIFIKSMSKRPFPQWGNKYVDIVDEYNWKAESVPLEMHLILQTKYQGEVMYPNHTSTVIEHWYNSYPDDMVNGGYPEYIPSIQQKSSRRLLIATVWNTRRSHDPTEGGCPAHNIPGVKYECVDKVSSRSDIMNNICTGRTYHSHVFILSYDLSSFHDNRILT